MHPDLPLSLVALNLTSLNISCTKKSVCVLRLVRQRRQSMHVTSSRVESDGAEVEACCRLASSRAHEAPRMAWKSRGCGRWPDSSKLRKAFRTQSYLHLPAGTLFSGQNTHIHILPAARTSAIGVEIAPLRSQHQAIYLAVIEVR